tara:strand:- start:61 stop:405 length:345 start_codon:yes stop_codon:yes gene_type:complete
MDEKINLIKEVYGRNTYTRVIDISFSELYTPVTASSTANQITVEQFFDYYNQLFFQIPALGVVNSHEYLVKRSTEYIGSTVLTDNEQAYIEEINSLREQLLEANQNFLSLNNIV